MAIQQASFFKSIEKTFGSQDKSINKLVKIAEDQEKREEKRDSEAKKEAANQKKKDKKEASDKAKKNNKATQNQNKSLIKAIGSNLLTFAKSGFKSIFGKNPLMTILKGVGLFALFKNAEALAQGIKGIAGAVADLWDTINSKDFKDGLGVITGFLSEIVKFGIGSFTLFLKGITDTANAIDDLLNGKGGWGDLVIGVKDATFGFVGLAAILAPKATLMLGLKAIQGTVGLLGKGLKGLNNVINRINRNNPTKPTGGTRGTGGAGAAGGGARSGPSSAGRAPVSPASGNVINPATGQPFKPGMAGTSAGRAPSIPKPTGAGAAAFSWKNIFTIKNLKSGITGGLVAYGLEYLGQQFIVNPFRKWLVEQKSGWITGWSEERIDKLIQSMQNKGKDYQAFQAAALLGAEQRKPGTLTEQQLLAIGALKLQRGGAVNVPGSGSGDKVPMMLPAGSFVMNRNASAHLQSGGMVPTMLEPGEKVYGPGQWGPAHALMNAGVPRFQNGGVVYGQHYDTGSGYTAPGMNDDQGRPVILSKDAMTAFVKMVTDSNGAVKASDVASSSRSAAKNNAVGGVPNSAHLYGEAIDIHGGSQAWMKQNGSKYGWKYIDYNGTHGGHFKYVDGDMMTLGGAPDTSGSLLSGLAGMDLSSLGGFAKMFDVLKPLAGLMGLTGSSLNLFGGSSTGTPSSNSAPLTGDAKAKARQMYDYMISKGVSPMHAKGILANINAESGFRLDVMGDGGTSGGLFQMHAGRYAAMEAAVPNWRTNWKGQIDHALATDRAPEYLGMSFANAGDAAQWFMNNYERPAQYVRGQRNIDQRAFIQGLGYQQGGVVGGSPQMKLMSGDANLMSNNIHVTPSQHTSSYNQASRMGRAMGMYDLGGSNKPVIVPMPVPSASSAPSGQASGGSQTPHVPAYPSSAAASDYIFRSAMSSMLS
ncbi:phage tail tip lysozyme [Synechococcus sp. AH-551-G15]|nr:phage tail tip lysozyme [Synechococcus sp. AH-551-G15]